MYVHSNLTIITKWLALMPYSMVVLSGVPCQVGFLLVWIWRRYPGATQQLHTSPDKLPHHYWTLDW